MSTADGEVDIHKKERMETSAEIWAPGGPVEDWTTDYDIRDQAYVEDPVPIWAEMRETCPIAHTERLGGSWNPTRFDDIRAMAKMVPELSSRQVLVMPGAPGMPEMSRYEQQIAAAPITADPPIHDWTRRMLLPAFAPKAVLSYEAYTEELCHELIDGFIEQGQCDGAVDYSQQIPPRVIAHMIGIDPGMADQFVIWVNGVLGEGLNDPELRLRTRDELLGFIGEEVAKRQSDPQEDLLTELLFMEIDHPEANITPEVVVGITNLLIVAGIDTTWSSIGSALWHLGTNPSDLERLCNEPELLPIAVEEFLRYYAPVTMARVADVDVEIGDVCIHAGDKVLMNFPAANHDPEHFEDPDEFIIDRARNRHVAFGSGVHRCAGSNLARLEMTTALGVWIERIPDFHVSDREPMRWAGGQVRGPRVMPMSFPAGTRR
ncbi:MAG: cytochrome P450 [Acidimicrobiales bacterium]|nr:MAG: cytochrome P450 [Acidimicrobiales bacterium]